jgi:hypothetical protein
MRKHLYILLGVGALGTVEQLSSRQDQLSGHFGGIGYGIDRGFDAFDTLI